MLFAFVYIVISIMLLYCIVLMIKTNLILRNNKSISRKSKLLNNKKLLIAIPCLREQNCIEETVGYFNKICSHIPLVIITTEKEIYENTGKYTLTTQDVVKNRILTKYDNVYWINYPYNEGYMSNQLNYLIKNINELHIFDNKCKTSDIYLALYNADSRPNKNTFNEIVDKINEGNLVIQQYSYYFKNYHKLNSVLKGFAIYQSNFEFKTGLINTLLKSKMLYTHVVGHGLIINIELLNSLGNFNTDFWCEDVYLSMQLKFNNINIVPILSLENVETPDNLLSLIKQNSVWFNTTWKFSKVYKSIKEKTGFKFCGMIGCLNEFRCAINWLCFPILIFTIILISFFKQNYIASLIVILTYIIYIYINTLMTIKIINEFDNKKYSLTINMLLSVFLATTISNLGPLYSLFIKSNVKYKTEWFFVLKL